MFPMTITISNPAQLNAVMAALNVGGIELPKTTPVAETVKEEAKATKTEPKVGEKATKTEPKVGEKATADQKPEALAQMTAGEAEKALHGHANNPARAPSYQDTADAVTKLARAKGRDAAVAVLAKFGAAKLPDVQPAQFAAVIAACEEAGA
jgi:hypothetical protein